MIDDIKINIEKNNNINNDINDIIYGYPSKESYKIVLLGDNEIGAKTSFMNVLVNGKFYFMLDIWDTSGQEKYIFLTIKTFAKDTDCVVLGYDVTNYHSFENIKNYYHSEIKKLGIELIYLIGNKIDLFENQVVSESEARDYAEHNGMRFFLISCKYHTGIEEFLEDLVKELAIL